MRYLITSSVTRTALGWTSTRQLPTFLLDSDVQGITSTDHAERIARRMLSEVAGDGVEVLVTAVPQDDTAPAFTHGTRVVHATAGTPGTAVGEVRTDDESFDEGCPVIGVVWDDAPEYVDTVALSYLRRL